MEHLPEVYTFRKQVSAKNNEAVKSRGAALLSTVFYFFVFFPFVQIIPVPSDTQPYALILSIIISIVFIFKIKRVPKIFMVLAGLFLVAVCISLLGSLNFIALRRIANYASLLFIPMATFFILDANRGINRLLLKIAIILWFIAGFVQTYLSPHFLDFIIADPRTKDDRGVFALAPEPAFYAVVCLFLFFSVMLFFKSKDKKIYGALLIIQIILFSKSCMIILFLLFFGLLYALLNIQTQYADLKSGRLRSCLTGKNLIIVGSLLLMTLLSYRLFELSYFKELRLVEIFMLFIDNPLYLIIKDKSGNERFGHMFFSMLGFIKNYGFPNGFDTARAFMQANLNTYNSVFWYMKPNDILMSGYGAALFELGFIALIIPLVITLSLYNFLFKLNKRIFWLYAISINLLLFNAIPLSFPILGFFLGCLIYYSKMKKDVFDVRRLYHRARLPQHSYQNPFSRYR